LLFFFTMTQSCSSISIQLFALIIALVDQRYVRINLYWVGPEKLLWLKTTLVKSFWIGEKDEKLTNLIKNSGKMNQILIYEVIWTWIKLRRNKIDFILNCIWPHMQNPHASLLSLSTKETMYARFSHRTCNNHCTTVYQLPWTVDF
jgi:hypothetical protein